MNNSKTKTTLIQTKVRQKTQQILNHTLTTWSTRSLILIYKFSQIKEVRENPQFQMDLTLSQKHLRFNNLKKSCKTLLFHRNNGKVSEKTGLKVFKSSKKKRRNLKLILLQNRKKIKLDRSHNFLRQNTLSIQKPCRTKSCK